MLGPMVHPSIYLNQAGCSSDIWRVEHVALVLKKLHTPHSSWLNDLFPSLLELWWHVTMLKSQYKKEIEQPVSINSPLSSIHRTCSVQQYFSVLHRFHQNLGIPMDSAGISQNSRILTESTGISRNSGIPMDSAGISQNSRILTESTGISRNSGIPLDSTRINKNPPLF